MKTMLRIPLRALLWSLLLLGGAFGMHLFTYSTTVEDSDLDHLRQFNDNYRVFSLTLPNELSFCDEAVPLDRLDVRERLDREDPGHAPVPALRSSARRRSSRLRTSSPRSEASISSMRWNVRIGSPSAPRFAEIWSRQPGLAAARASGATLRTWAALRRPSSAAGTGLIRL